MMNQFLKEPLSDEKIKKLLEEYSRPANCNSAKAQLCNPEIWRLNLETLQRLTDKMLQKVLLHAAKASYDIIISCDKPFQTGGEFKEILT